MNAIHSTFKSSRFRSCAAGTALLALGSLCAYGGIMESKTIVWVGGGSSLFGFFLLMGGLLNDGTMSFSREDVPVLAITLLGACIWLAAIAACLIQVIVGIRTHSPSAIAWGVGLCASNIIAAVVITKGIE